MNRNEPIIVIQNFANPKKEVWKTITQLDQMNQWFFEEIPAFEPKVGFSTSFNIKSDTRDFMHLWKITDVIPGRKIVYDWQYQGYSGKSTVTFELFEKADQTLLKLSAEGIESFPQHISEFRRESCTNGWIYFINDRLKNYLDQKQLHK